MVSGCNKGATMKKWIIFSVFAIGYFIWALHLRHLCCQNRIEIEKLNSLISHLEQKAIWITIQKQKIPSYISDIDKYRILSAVWEYGEYYNIPKDILLALIEQESQYIRSANGNDGEIGLCQIIPQTAWLIIKAYHLPIKTKQEIYDIENNILIAAIYLRDLLNLYNQDLTRALAHYNHGRGGNTVRGRSYAQKILQKAGKYAL
jgi:soluble lytic murein transglycosylase-like protein